MCFSDGVRARPDAYKVPDRTLRRQPLSTDQRSGNAANRDDATSDGDQKQWRLKANRDQNEWRSTTGSGPDEL